MKAADKIQLIVTRDLMVIWGNKFNTAEISSEVAESIYFQNDDGYSSDERDLVVSEILSTFIIIPSYVIIVPRIALRRIGFKIKNWHEGLDSVANLIEEII